jgi:competence ComEA-like helix-hairpin-helix protein
MVHLMTYKIHFQSCQYVFIVRAHLLSREMDMFVNESQAPAYQQTLLRLAGNCGFRIDGDRVLVSLDSIVSDRDYGNISGSLNIELWAMQQPYTSGEPEGECLAATTIGTLSGGHFLPECRYDLIFNKPSAGRWNLVLLLREWSEQGLVTCDQVNFDVPFEAYEDQEVTLKEAPANLVLEAETADSEQVQVAEQEVAEQEVADETVAEKVAAKEAQQAIAKAAAAAKEAAAKEAAAKEAAAKEAAAKEAAAKEAAAKEAAAKEAAAKEAAAKEAAAKEAAAKDAAAKEAAAKEAAAKEAAAKEAAAKLAAARATSAAAEAKKKLKNKNQNGPVNVNNASLEELNGVKGLPTKVAESMIEARPFSKLEDIMKVKGMGPKMFNRVRDLLTM